VIPGMLAALDLTKTLEGMRHGFVNQTEHGADLWWKILGLAFFSALAIALLVLLNRLQQGRSAAIAPNSGALFRQVIKELSLGLPDRIVLTRVAHELKLANPTIMLLTPQLFAETVRDYLAVSSGGNTAGEMTRLAAIHKRLFNQEMPSLRTLVRRRDAS